MNNYPLVSIIVLTYNSSSFVTETLNSIKLQTYNKIELIITDDASTDDTVIICNKWLEDNSNIFQRFNVISNKVNQGVSKNCNIGVNDSNGKWIKIIGGDDALRNQCIKTYVDYINKDTKSLCVQSTVVYYRDTFAEENYMYNRSFSNHAISKYTDTPSKQAKVLYRGCFVNSQSIFINKDLIKSLGGFDERIRNMEDWPMWIRLANNNIPIKYIPDITVNYRVHSKSLSNTINTSIILSNQFYQDHLVYKMYIKDNVSILERLLSQYTFIINKVFYKNFNKATMINIWLYKILNLPHYIRTFIINNYYSKYY